MWKLFQLPDSVRIHCWLLGSLAVAGWLASANLLHADSILGGYGRLVATDADATESAPRTAPITSVTIDVQPSEGELPRNFGQEKFAREANVPLDRPASLGLADYVSFWQASNIAYQPLYFEDVNLERYGYQHCHLQPLISAAHFFGRIPAIPYFMGVRHPRQCIYPLGFAQPGDCTPRHHYWVPWSTKGALLQGAAVTGLIFAIP